MEVGSGSGRSIIDTIGRITRKWRKEYAVASWLSDYNEAMENSVRLAAYKAALDNGMSRERAASLWFG